MLSRELEVTLNLAFKNAREKRHEFMTVEHLLLALLDDASASSVLKACGADLNALREDLSEFIDSTMPTIPDAQLEQETQPTQLLQMEKYYNLIFLPLELHLPPDPLK